jgi:hypothetical protein
MVVVARFDTRSINKMANSKSWWGIDKPGEILGMIIMMIVCMMICGKTLVQTGS